MGSELERDAEVAITVLLSIGSILDTSNPATTENAIYYENLKVKFPFGLARFLNL